MKVVHTLGITSDIVCIRDIKKSQAMENRRYVALGRRFVGDYEAISRVFPEGIPWKNPKKIARFELKSSLLLSTGSISLSSL